LVRYGFFNFDIFKLEYLNSNPKQRVRLEDIPLARNDSTKYVMVFTDGESTDRYRLQTETVLLQSVVDKVYGFGIGAGANPEELSWIATDDREGHGWKIMSDFSNYQTFIRNFINRFGGCKTTKVQPYRNVIFCVLVFTSFVLFPFLRLTIIR